MTEVIKELVRRITERRFKRKVEGVTWKYIEEMCKEVAKQGE